MGFELEPVQFWSSCSSYRTRSVAKKGLYLFDSPIYFVSSTLNEDHCKKCMLVLGNSCRSFLVTLRKVKHSVLCLDVKLHSYSGIYSCRHLQIATEEVLICVFVFAGENGNEFHA